MRGKCTAPHPNPLPKGARGKENPLPQAARGQKK